MGYTKGSEPTVLHQAMTPAANTRVRRSGTESAAGRLRARRSAVRGGDAQPAQSSEEPGSGGHPGPRRSL
jgi:hypothetical protein